jgi:hypothetical protein
MSLPKTSKLVLLGLLTIVSLFLLIITLANFSAFDEKLSPEIQAILQPDSMPEDSKNAYYAIFGLSAANGKNIVDTGKRLVKRNQHNREEINTDEQSKPDNSEIHGVPDLDKNWLNEFDNCTSRRSLSCARNLAKELLKHPIQSKRLPIMSMRYRSVLDMSDFQSVENITFTSSLPPYNVMMKLRQLYLAEAIQLKSVNQFFMAMNKDIVFWRMLLSNGNSLIDKMVAVASLWADMQTISDYLKTNTSLSNEQRKQLNQLLKPLTKDEIDINEAFQFEEKVFYNSLRTINPSELSTALGTSSTPMFWFIQPNATLNDYHEYFVKPLAELNLLSAEDFAKTINKSTAGEKSCCFEEIDSLTNISPSNLYNVGGKMLLSSMLFRAQDYIARVHDLNGVIDLVRLQVQVANTDLPIIEFLGASSIKQPYNKQPMNYDKETNLLGFDCLDKGSVCQVSLSHTE